MKKEKEVAILFKRLKDKEGVATRYKPVKYIIGYFDNNIFCDLYGNVYTHMSTTEQEGYGFGLRCSLKDIHYIYKRKHVLDSVKAYFNEYKYSFFYYGSPDNTYNNIYLVAENPIIHSKRFLEDKDFNFNIKDNSFDTKALINNVSNKVIGQDDAIDDVVTTLWQNVNTNNKKNMLLVGPTGVGKSEIVKTIAKELDLPLVIANGSDFIKNDGLNNVLIKLINASNGDIERAQQGIIVMDGFDGLLDSNDDDNISSYVQDELLKLADGVSCRLDLCDSNDNNLELDMDTSKITFIAIGSFDNLNINNNMGFRVSNDNSNNNVTSNYLIKRGIMPKLMGRIPVIINLNPVTEDILIEIMNNPNYDILREKREILDKAGITLRINNVDAVREKIAKRAISKNVGVRGLNSVLEKTFVKAMCEVSQSNGEYSELIIDENTVDDPKNYVLKRKKC